MPSTKKTPTDDFPEIQKTIRFIGRRSEIKSEELDSKIVKAIRDCPGLTALHLELYNISMKTAGAVGKSLESQSNLKTVAWKHMFNYTDKREIPQALTYLVKGVVTANAHIVVLDLSDNYLESGGIVGLKHFFESPSCYTLEELYLNNNRLESVGAKLLSYYISRSIENSRKDGKPMNLKVFECGYNNLGNMGIAFIANSLDGLSSLESIDLAYNGIGPSGISALSSVFYSNILLERITLDGNNLFECGVNSLSCCLKSLKKLQILGLQQCRVGPNGILHLAMAMKQFCPEVRKIDLRYNGIDSNIDVLLDAMENKKYFEDLDISCNGFSETEEESLQLRIFSLQRKVEMMSSDDDIEMSDDSEYEV